MVPATYLGRVVGVRLNSKRKVRDRGRLSSHPSRCLGSLVCTLMRMDLRRGCGPAGMSRALRASKVVRVKGRDRHRVEGVDRALVGEGAGADVSDPFPSIMLGVDHRLSAASQRAASSERQ